MIDNNESGYLEDYSTPEVKETIKDMMVENIIMDAMGGNENYLQGRDHLSGFDKLRLMNTYHINEGQMNRCIKNLGC